MVNDDDDDDDAEEDAEEEECSLLDRLDTLQRFK